MAANDFCKWRTDRVNEAILVREGIIDWHFATEKEVGAFNKKGKDGDYVYDDKYVSTPENMFTTENY